MSVKENIKFDLDEDVLFQIAMMSYVKYNDNLCSINEHLGEIYSYKDLVDAEELQVQYEKHLLEIAVKQLQQTIKKVKNNIIKDIAMIKKQYVNKDEIIMRLEENVKILGDKE